MKLTIRICDKFNMYNLHNLLVYNTDIFFTKTLWTNQLTIFEI